jgi:hypothetical protein
MAETLEIAQPLLINTLQYLSSTGLLTLDGEHGEVDKEVRKYFDAQIEKFEEDFKPGVEYWMGLLRNVPIHLLLSWYAIPRSSNNIFASIIERYLETPQVYYRYVQDFTSTYPALAPLIKDLFSSPDLRLSRRLVMDHYHMTALQFEEAALFLEFNLIACWRYQKVDGVWEEILTPFQEWSDHLEFLRKTQAQPILEEEEIVPFRPQPFSFVQDLSALLKQIKSKPISPSSTDLFFNLLKLDKENEKHKTYLAKLLTKLELLKFVDIVDGEFRCHQGAETWLGLREEDRALFLYRHTNNRLISPYLKEAQPIDKRVREAEKSILRVLMAGWVSAEDVVAGALVHFGDEPMLVLQKIGRHWSYTRPRYTPEQANLLHAVLEDWLFEIGAVAIASYGDVLCLKATEFGCTLFGS